MAYVSKETKSTIKAALDPLMKKHGIKYSLRVSNHTTLVCTIRKAPMDFIRNYNECKTDEGHYDRYIAKDYIQVNQYRIERDFTGKCQEVLDAVNQAMHIGHYDRSDSQTDYFECSWFVNIHIGEWNKPFEKDSGSWE